MDVLTIATNDTVSQDPRDMALGNSYTLSESFDSDSDYDYDRPIAVLTGPKSISMGDIFPYVLAHHPRARRFGRPTNGAFGSWTELWSGADPYVGDFDAWFTNAIFADANETWLHRSVQTPDEEVWLTRDDVAAGRDTVVEAALAWISSAQKSAPAAHQKAF